jgi:hypothetical protein
MKVFCDVGEYVEYDDHLGFDITKLSPEGVTFFIIEPTAKRYVSLLNLGYEDCKQGIATVFTLPRTEAPATEAPATEAPATEAPATEAPATEAPATEAPATEAPATEAPATEAPATEAPTRPSLKVTIDTEPLETLEVMDPVDGVPSAPEFIAQGTGLDAKNFYTFRLAPFNPQSTLELDLSSGSKIRYNERLEFEFIRDDDEHGIVLAVIDPLADQQTEFVAIGGDDKAQGLASIIAHTGKQFAVQGVLETETSILFRVVEVEFPVETTSDCNCNKR